MQPVQGRLSRVLRGIQITRPPAGNGSVFMRTHKQPDPVAGVCEVPKVRTDYRAVVIACGLAPVAIVPPATGISAPSPSMLYADTVLSTEFAM